MSIPRRQPRASIPAQTEADGPSTFCGTVAPGPIARAVAGLARSGVRTLMRWAIAGLSLVLLPTLLFAAPGWSDGAASAAVAILAALVLASVVALYSGAHALTDWGASAATGPNEEDRRRHGTLRRQCAPGVPGRPARPRAPGLAPAA